MKHVLICLAALFVSQISFAQTVVRTMMHDGIEREYRLYVADMYDGSVAVPLVINLHGYTSNAFEQEAYGNFKLIADTANFILVHPEGTTDATGTTFWNAFGSPTETVDDIGFLSALIDTIAAGHNLDMNRVYSTGMSNGGFMSYTLACQLGYRFAAIASVTGTMVTLNLNACSPAHPTPVMQIHGTADPTVPYLGSPQGFVGVEDLVDYWVSYNNCNPTPIQTAVPDTNMTDGCTADHFVYSGGDMGSSVEFYRINGGGHTWPGSHPLFAIGVTNRDFSASIEIWRFFSQYSLDGLVGIEESDVEKPFIVYPNPTSGNTSIRFSSVGERTIQVHNAQGQLVQQFNSKSQIAELILPKSGVYILTVTSEEGTVSEKLIRE